MIIASIIIVVIVVVCFMTNPKNDNPIEGNDSENNIVEAGEYTPKDTLTVEELASGEEKPENYTISKSNNDKKEQILLPVIPDVVKKVDIKEKKIIVKLLNGLEFIK